MKILLVAEAAALFQVCPRTIAKWFDDGTLKGFRLPPAGKNRPRRITAASAMALAKKLDLPADHVELFCPGYAAWLNPPTSA